MQTCHFPSQVIFEVAFNGPKGGYVALDDISFSPVHCQNQTGESCFFFLTWDVPASPDVQSWPLFWVVFNFLPYFPTLSLKGQQLNNLFFWGITLFHPSYGGFSFFDNKHKFSWGIFVFSLY